MVSAGAVVYREDGGSRLYLLLHYPSGHWDLVKGKMEEGESARQTAVREAMEETGIVDLQFVDGFEESVRYDFHRSGRRVRKRVIFYLARTRAEDVTLSREHVGFSWLGFEDAVARATYGNARGVLAVAEKSLRGGSGARAG